MKRITLLFSIGLCIFSNYIVAQNADTFEQESESVQNATAAVSTQGSWESFPSHTAYTTTNPDVNFMIRNINTATDKYTGIANVKIPIYDVELNAGSLPIYISYCTSGIRADDVSSIVGLGWRLSAGGKITRVVRGEPDNFEQLTSTMDILKWTSENYEKWHTKEWDTQPDLYYFELPNLSGSFVFNVDKKAYPIPYQSIKIDFDDNNNQFKIYDERGNCYHFNTTEVTWEQFPINVNQETKEVRKYISSWWLDKIEFLNGDVVSFKYLTGARYQYKNNHDVAQLDYILGDTRSLPMGSVQVAPTIINNNPKYLSRITYREQQIDFSYENGGDFQNMKKLKSVTVSTIGASTNQISRNFEFTYGTFRGSQRLKLTGIQERASENLIKPICNFEYYENIDAPTRSSWAIDHWGFYNGPTEKYSYYPNVPMVSELDPKVVAPAFYSASRESNLEYTRVQSLKRILYPNGGYKEFEYELHKGQNPRTQQVENAGGLRIRKIIENNGSTSSTHSYTYNGGVIYDDSQNYILSHSKSIDAKETRYTFYLSSRNLSTSVDYFGASVVYSSVTETLPNKSSIQYEYMPLNNYRDVPGQLYVQNRDYAAATGVELKGRTPKTSLAWGRNLLRRKTMFDAMGNEVASESFIYKADSTTMNRIPGYTTFYSYQKRNGLLYTDFYIGEYFSVSCPILLERQITYKGKYNLSSKTIFSYKSNHLVSMISEIGSDGAETAKSYTFPQDFAITDTTSVVGKLIQRNAIVPLEEITTRNGKIIAAQGRSYRFNGTNKNAVVLDCERSLRKATPIDPSTFTPVRCTTSGITFNNLYQLDKNYLDYNSSGQLLCYRDEAGVDHSFVYRNTTRPIATILNARHSENPAYNQVYYNDFEDDPSSDSEVSARSGDKARLVYSGTSFTIDRKFSPGSYILTYHTEGEWNAVKTPVEIANSNTSPAINFGRYFGYIDDIIMLPRNATISTSCYVPGWGNVSETTEQGLYFKTEYNGFGLPVKITDHRNITIKQFDYK